MALDKNTLIKLFFLLFIIISFFLGFPLREFVPGGAAGDFINITWPLLQSFKQDFLFSIKNYGIFGEASYPLFYIINSYLNPFSSNQVEFILSITFISFIGFIFFSYLIKKKNKISTIDCLLTASLILLLPFYRSSAYWGTTENFAWLFLILSFIFFLDIKENTNNKVKNKTTTIFFLCFFSSCALYIRPAFIFWPISFFLYLFLVNKDKKIIITSILSYLIFSIPGFILIFIWGNVYDSQNMTMNLTEDYHNYKNIIKNIPILLSYFAFYLFPILIIEFLDIGINKFLLKYRNVFLLALSTFLILWQTTLLDYLGSFTYGGGAILKLNYLIKPENFILLLFSSAIGFAILFEIVKENFKTNISILIPIFIIYGFPTMLFQEYLEPLILILFYSGILQTKLNKIYFNKILNSNIITTLYFSAYLIGATYYKHFI